MRVFLQKLSRLLFVGVCVLIAVVLATGFATGSYRLHVKKSIVTKWQTVTAEPEAQTVATFLAGLAEIGTMVDRVTIPGGVE